MPPPIRYVRNGDVSIAYQVVGDAPLDVLMIPGWVSHLALDWDEPTWVRWCERMTRFARLLRFDKRGTGMSDRPAGVPTLEQRMEDARCVLDAVGVERAHIRGWSEGGPLAVLLAVSHPDRVQSLVLYGTQARFVAAEDYPWGPTEEETRADIEQLVHDWGATGLSTALAPSAGQAFAERYAAYRMAAASPSAARDLQLANAAIDIRPLLPSVRAPTLVLSRRGDPVGPPEPARFLADHIPGAQFVELDGDDHVMWVGDVDALCGEIGAFLTGVRPSAPEPGSVTAILQCDIEASTVLASDLGDERWSDVLAGYERLADVTVQAHGGRVCDRIGDGLMAAFPGPVSAIRAARSLQREARSIGIRVRAGVHFGEVLERDGALRGIAVHLAARVMSKAAGDEVLVSQTVRDIVAGSELEFEDHGMHELKGIDRPRRLFAVR